MGIQAKKVTEGISISVETRFQPDQSLVEQKHYLFSYHIIIENKSDYTVQLISRHWDIFDSNNEKTVVDGEGVIGEKPILDAGESYEYQSACSLATDIGKMKGYYMMERKIDNKTFRVTIPEFELVAPERLN